MFKNVQEIKKQMDAGKCLHCPHNPKAVEPFIKMHKIELTSLAEALATKYAEQVNIPKSCILCFAVRMMCKSDIDFMEVIQGRK